MAKKKIKDFTMAYTDQGDGTPILFIHGYPLNRNLWEPQLQGLSRAARLIAPDLRGFGESEPAPGIDFDPQTYSMELFADDCVTLLDVLDITEPVVVCGLSMGGYIAFALYRNHPERVAGLVLAATRAGADSPKAKSSREEAIALARESGPDAVAESMQSKLLSPKTYQEQPDLVEKAKSIMQASSVEGIVGALKGMKERPDFRPLLHEIKVPTLLFHGGDDQIISMDEMLSMREDIPSAKLVILPDCGHLLNLEQPQMFNQDLRDFIQAIN